MTALNALQMTFVNRWANVLFVIGKSVRLIIMLTFLWLLKNNVNSVAGYSAAQMLVFYVTYQFLDTLLQVFYRGAYTFGNKVRDGSLDGILSRPINPLFRILTGEPDINDAIFIIPSTILSFYIIFTSGVEISIMSSFFYCLLLINSFVIGTALHIFIVGLTLVTTDVDNIMWLYRDVSRLGQFPVNIYFEGIRLALFFLVPIGFMITIPAQVLIQTPPSYSLILATLVGATSLFLSLRFWNSALKKYNSASS